MAEITLTKDRILENALRHFAGRQDELLRKTRKGQSFELWLNCEFVRACQRTDLIALNEVGYATFLEQEKKTEYPSRHHADILLINPKTRHEWVIESTFVGDRTQPKWKSKIVADANKLRRIDRPRVRKFILIFCTSFWQRVIDDGQDGGAWDSWFNVIRDRCTKLRQHQRSMPLGKSGEFALKLWEVSSAGC